MALKLLFFLAILKLGISVPDPDPDSNIDINVKQVVNGGGCCPESELDCNTYACEIAGGHCQPKGDMCNGYLREGPIWCSKNYGCCIPKDTSRGTTDNLSVDYLDTETLRGCTYGSASYKNGSYLDTSNFDDCGPIQCVDGDWQILNTNCTGLPCNCVYVSHMDDDDDPVEGGCILGEPNLPGMSCNCTIDNTAEGCDGSIVGCLKPLAWYCKNSGTGLGFCIQSGGDCNGYAVADPYLN